MRSLVADEPPYVLDADAVITSGRRRRRRRATAVAVGVGGTCALVVGAMVALQPAPVRDSVTTTRFGASGPQGPIESAVRAHTPASWTFAHVEETDASGFSADVNDGKGASRLSVGVSPSPGSLQQHP